VDASGDLRIERRYARLVGLPLVHLGRLHGPPRRGRSTSSVPPRRSSSSFRGASFALARSDGTPGRCTDSLLPRRRGPVAGGAPLRQRPRSPRTSRSVAPRDVAGGSLPGECTCAATDVGWHRHPMPVKERPPVSWTGGLPRGHRTWS
jgi:hypothetical protein